jgi:hypothetical protein
VGGGIKKAASVKVKRQGLLFENKLFFAGAAAAGGLLVFLFLHGAGLSTFGTFFWFAPAFFCSATLFTLKYSHFVSPFG